MSLTTVPTTPHKSSATQGPSLSSMSTTMPSSSNFQLISKAFSDYAKETGIDLTTNPFADELQNCDSADAVSQLLQDRARAFKAYRDEHRKLINSLSPVVQFLRTFSGTLGQAAVVSPTESSHLSLIILRFPSQIPFPPANAVLVGIDVLVAVCISFTFSEIVVISGSIRLLAVSMQVMMRLLSSSSVSGIS
jgi:fungal STAND N-terminal Goodbye domain